MAATSEPKDFANFLNQAAQSFSQIKDSVDSFSKGFSQASSQSHELAQGMLLAAKSANLLKENVKLSSVLFQTFSKNVKNVESNLNKVISGTGKSLDKEFKKYSKRTAAIEQMIYGKKGKPDLAGNKKMAEKKGEVLRKGLFEGMKDKTQGTLEKTIGLDLSGGPMAIGIGILVKAFTSLYEQINMILKVSAQTTRTFGSMGDTTAQTTRQATSMGFRFEKLGLSFDGGAKSVLDFVKATKQASISDASLIETGVKLTQVYGLSADEAGRLSIAFDRAGFSNKDLADTMVDATDIAKQMNVPVNDLIQAMGKDINTMQRFGIRNRQEFLKAAAVAEVYGTSLDKVSDALWEQLGTFEKSSDVAAKLNSVFGTHINSYQLMLAESPLDNMKLISTELINQGKNWDKLNVQEKRVLKSTLGLDEETLALVLSQKNMAKGTAAVAKAFEDQQKKQKRMADAQKNWSEAIGKLQETLINFQAHFRNIFAELGRNIIAFFGGLFGSKKSPDQLVKGAFDTVKGGLESVEKFLKGNQGAAKEWGENLRKWIKVAADFIEIKLVPAFEKIDRLLDKLDKFAGGNIGKALAGGGWSSLVDLHWGEDQEEQQNKQVKGYRMGGKDIMVQDALVTKTGQVIKFNQNDNILATKSPISRSAQGATAIAGKGAGNSEQIINIMPAPIILDGKVIAEVLFRQTRR